MSPLFVASATWLHTTGNREVTAGCFFSKLFP
jgi:hypothetical protein